MPGKSFLVKFKIPIIGDIEAGWDSGLSLKLISPLGEISGSWQPDKDEQNASWEMYLELVTRISIAKLGEDEGILREALESLHSLFKTGRDLLRKYGPKIARPKGKHNLCFGYITVSILNLALRPFLSRWHPLLSDHESKKSAAISQYEHEKKWKLNRQFRKELEQTRQVLLPYTELLAKAAGIKPLFEMEETSVSAK